MLHRGSRDGRHNKENDVDRAVNLSAIPVVVLSLAVAGCAGTVQRDAGSGSVMPVSSAKEMWQSEPRPLPDQEMELPSGQVTPRREAEISLGSGAFINRSVAQRPAAQKVEGDVTLNFDNTAITEVVKVVLGDILGENYVIDPAIKGNVSLKTSQPVKRDALLPILEELLKMNGAAMSWDGTMYRVAPLASAMRGGTPRLAQRGAPMMPGYGAQIFPLRYISAKEMLKILEGMVPKENLLLVDEHRNLLVLGGTSQELEGWRDTVEIFDVDWMAGYSVGVFPLQYADATSIGDELKRIVGEHMNADSAGMIKIESLDRLNALMVLTPQPRYLERMRVWIERLDRIGDEPGIRLYTYEVKNRKASELASVLTSVFGEEGRSREGARPAGLAPGTTPVKLSTMSEGAPKAPAPANGSGGALQELHLPAGGQVRIVADESNNSILIMASARDFQVIESALKRLDVQEMQVLIEASILEVSLTDELSYGLEWYFKNNDVYKGKIGEGLLDLNDSLGIGAAIPGFSYTLSGNGVVSAVLNALANDSKLNVISSPSLMVLDNRTARISVGDQVPVKSETATTDAGVIIESIQFKDTGVQLEVTPRINSGGLITMEIRQDVTDVGEPEVATGQRSFRQRNIQSTIAIQNGDTIMLGGLITENDTGSESGVPFLRDIPVLGGLFGRTTESNRRTELVVLITPRVVRNSNDARMLTEEYRLRMNNMRLRAEQTLAFPEQ